MSRLISIIVLFLFIASCSTPKPKGKTEAEVLYKEAIYLKDKGRYILATEKLAQLKSQFPYSFYATHAELLHADILFEQENFVESAAAYILFRDFHPRHKRVPYVVWKIAESYYMQLPSTFDRDLSPGDQAIKYLKEVIQRFPNSDNVSDAKAKMQEIEEMKRNKDLYIADFYYKIDEYDAAIFRYKYILNKHKEQKIREHSMLRIVKGYYNTESFSKCVNAANNYTLEVGKRTRKKIIDYKEMCTERSKDKASHG